MENSDRAFTAQHFLQKYDHRELAELLSQYSSNWLLSGDEHNLPLEAPSGIIRQMNNISDPNIIILAPFDSRLPLDYKVVHQIVRELTVGIYGFHEIPQVNLLPNYDQSSTCQLPPAYYDTKVGQIIINVDYTMKAIWHGSYICREKRTHFSELWRANMAVDSNGDPQTQKDISEEFLKAGFTDISADRCYQDIYTKSVNVDPTYDPNSPEEENLFSQYSESTTMKLSANLTSVRQHQNLFVFEGCHHIFTAVRLTEDKMDLATYQRFQKRLTEQVDVVRKYLENNSEVCRDLAYLRLIAFLVPLLISLRKKMLIPNLSQMLSAMSEDKLKTEREVPPHFLRSNFACKHFPRDQGLYFHLHGGIEFDVGTPPLDGVTEEMRVAFRTLQIQAANYLHKLHHQESTFKTHFPVPLSEIEGKSYNVISFELESLYLQSNMVQWWGAVSASIKTLKEKTLPVTDIELHEQLKKTFGHTKAIKYKNVAYALKAAAERGLGSVFDSLTRRIPAAHLNLLDEQGFSLLHHAAANNQSHIIVQLASAGVNLNQTRGGRFTDTGLTALHLAAQFGSLDSLNCLLALRADYRALDQRGWMPIHFGAFYGQVACIQSLCRIDPALLEVKTSAGYGSSSLLLTTKSGSVEALDVLLSSGANWREKDSEGNNAVHLATLYFHTNVLRHLIQLNLDGLPVWKILVEMLQSENLRRLEKALRCLEALSVNAESCEDIMDAGAVPALVHVLSSNKPLLQCMASAVLCHLSENSKVCEELVHSGALPMIVEFLRRHQPELNSRCAVILSDLARHSMQHQILIADLGGVPLVVNLLTSEFQDVLLNAIKCIGALCVGSPRNQTAVAEAGGVRHLVEFLSVNSEALQEGACLALTELVLGHKENQTLICEAGGVESLVQILRDSPMSVKVKAAAAIQALASKNPAVQQSFLSQSAAPCLLQLLKVFQIEAQEQGAMSLWTLAGQSPKEQKLMAEQMGYAVILELLLSLSDKLQYVGCRAAIALIRDSHKHQDDFCRGKGVSPLVHLLRGSRTTQIILLSVIEALGCLCIGVALTTNKNSQRIINTKQVIPSLLDLLKENNSLDVKVQASQTLACVLMGNQALQRDFWEQEEFSYESILELLNSDNKSICLGAGYALTLFAYKNEAQQKAIMQLGGIPVKTYKTFLDSDNEDEKAKAAFQIVVLARVIRGLAMMTLNAKGVTILVELLKSCQPTTVILAAQFLASLARMMRAGITDAILTMGALQHLSAHLESKNEEVRTACSNALGYLTFNQYARQQLLAKCRRSPQIYELLMSNLASDAKISDLFTAEFERQRRIGFPSLSLEINGGPPVPHGDNKGQSKRVNSRLGQSAAGEKETSVPDPQHARQKSRTSHYKIRVGQTP